MTTEEVVDVVIIGAGISGIGAAYRITERNPGTSYVILERRARIGGTWDLFRYPGVRSDSSIFTLCLPYEPWTQRERVADGDEIRDYLTDTARKHGIDDHIRFNNHVVAADWDSATDTWTITADEDGTRRTYRSRFVFFGSGYYNYDDGYTPDFPGAETFAGTLVHPQHWPEELDYAGKKVVVIGSGATAMSLVPALAEEAGQVTLLQRTPTYLISATKYSRFVDVVAKLLPRRLAHPIIRFVMAMFEGYVWFLARKTPPLLKWILRRTAVQNLPAGYAVDTHFKPPYEPWDQRLCLIPDADLYNEISAGRVEMVTDRIDHFDATGIALQSGAHLDADIIVTATGLQLQALGGVRISLDGTEIKPTDRFVYKAHMLEDVPNLIWCIGYTNASWTLKADLIGQYVCRILNLMDAKGQKIVVAHNDDPDMPVERFVDFSSGYFQRVIDQLPKQGARKPWKLYQNYAKDLLSLRYGNVEDGVLRLSNPPTSVSEKKEKEAA